MEQPIQVTNVDVTLEVVKTVPVEAEAAKAAPEAAKAAPVEAEAAKAAPVEAEAAKAAPVEAEAAKAAPEAAKAAPVEAEAAKAAPVAAIPKIINEVFEALTKDEKFLAAVKVSVDKILKDGKVDQSDIPELVFIISETLNSISSFNLTIDLIPVVIKMVYKFIVDKYNLVPEDKKADFERIVDSSLRLLMFQPKVRSGLSACFAFLSCKH